MLTWTVFAEPVSFIYEYSVLICSGVISPFAHILDANSFLGLSQAALEVFVFTILVCFISIQPCS